MYHLIEMSHCFDVDSAYHLLNGLKFIPYDSWLLLQTPKFTMDIQVYNTAG